MAAAVDTDVDCGLASVRLTPMVFWAGLGLVRRRSPELALGLHIAANASGVLLGHLSGEDSF